MPENKSTKESETVTTTEAAGAEGAPSGSAATTNDTASTKATRSNENAWATAFGVGFWVVVIGIVVVARFWSKSADIVLEVSPADPLIVNGVVLYEGAAVDAGYVQLTLDEPKTKRFLSSTVLPLTNHGRFATSGQFRFNGAATNMQLRITAAFEGQVPAKDGKTNHISGEAVVYTNYSPPVAKFNLWAGAVVMLLFILILMVLFTGSMSRRGARYLFAVTYLCTFVSLAVPVALILVVSQNNYLVQVMEESPVGLVKAKAKGVSDPQWLLNIGGIVQSGLLEADLLKAASTAIGPRPATNNAPAATSVQARSGGSPALSEDRISAPNVIGGLAIPFYVVILAMFGAGINMTRQVPDIQRRYDLESLEQSKTSALRATLNAPIALFTAATWQDNQAQAGIVAGIRKEIIESYMGLLSAPFLAIAIYYVLQVIATSVAEPILVLMAFATGLISDGVVTWIINFAQKILRKDTTHTAAGPPPFSGKDKNTGSPGSEHVSHKTAPPPGPEGPSKAGKPEK